MRNFVYFLEGLIMAIVLMDSGYLSTILTILVIAAVIAACFFLHVFLSLKEREHDNEVFDRDYPLPKWYRRIMHGEK